VKGFFPIYELKVLISITAGEIDTDTHFSPRALVYRALDAPEVQQVEVAGQGASQWSEGTNGRHAVFPGQHGQCQHLMVQDGGGHVTEQRWEADWSAVHRLEDTDMYQVTF